MLPAASRLRRREEFTLAFRRGRRASATSLVAHYLAPDRNGDTGEPARIGFVVSRQVGGSVDRHRVIRRLRHVARERLESFPPGSLTVVRALPPSAERTSAELARDLDFVLKRLIGGKGCH